MSNEVKKFIAKGIKCNLNKKKYSWKVIHKICNVHDPKRIDKEIGIWICEGILILIILMGKLIHPSIIGAYELLVFFIVSAMICYIYLSMVIIATSLNTNLMENCNDEIYYNNESLEIMKKKSVLIIPFKKDIVIWEYNETIIITQIKKSKIKKFLYVVQLENIDYFRKIISEKIQYNVI